MAKKVRTPDTSPLISLDITTITLGEMAEAEAQSGRSMQSLIKGRASTLLLALFIHELRNSAQPRSWLELSNLRLQDARRSISGSQLDSERPSPTSNG